jgi:aminoglycoside phosphotransferase (APT) family kinase protein
MVRGLADAPLAALLLLEGRIAIEEWVDGTPLAALPRRVDDVRRAGDVLGRLHATRRIGARRLRARASTRPLVAVTERRLARLSAGGALTGAEVRALRRVLGRFAPPVASWGVTHNDFCAENLVERPSGELVAVDNEGMRLGFLDYDLARTRYRWAMPATAWRAFLDGYAGWRDPGGYVRHAPFWCVAALVKSAHVRFGRTEAADVPLGRLRKIVVTRGACAQAVPAPAARRTAASASRKDSTRRS